MPEGLLLILREKIPGMIRMRGAGALAGSDPPFTFACGSKQLESLLLPSMSRASHERSATEGPRRRKNHMAATAQKNCVSRAVVCATWLIVDPFVQSSKRDEGEGDRGLLERTKQ